MDNLPEPQLHPNDARFIDLTGERFGRLCVLYFAGQDKWRASRWYCQCDCGSSITTAGNSLNKGLVQSCGCLHRERSSAAASTHRQTGTPEYHVWQQAKARCYNPRNRRYPTYGARGITMCDRWRNSFENFLTDMGPRPSSQHSIDRIDNNKGYSPNNCRWATAAEQSRNRRTTRLLTYKGDTLPAKDLAAKYGVPYKTLMSRLYQGWAINKALETLVQ